MSRRVSLAFSPCPNDTFLFFGIADRQVTVPGLHFDITLADVETLNRAAHSRTHDITKLSIAALMRLQPDYRMLNAGAAMGHGCGPVIVSRPDVHSAPGPDTPIAVPGILTTACLLTGLYLKTPPLARPMSFEEIMPAVQQKKVDFGVVIHEGRFTYPKYGLTAVVDLGAWWETLTGLPVPLGCIAADTRLEPEVTRTIEQAIVDSAAFALSNPRLPMPFVIRHAKEMDPSVISRHIGLYVNEFSLDIRPTGTAAIETITRMAQDCGLLEQGEKNEDPRPRE